MSSVSIPTCVVGMFIGPGGANIKAMKRKTGASISVGRKPLRGGRFQLVSIRGPRSGRNAGEAAVREWLASEKVQGILTTQSERKQARYNNRRKLVVVEDGGWNTVVKGRGTAQERVQQQFWDRTEKECAAELEARNFAVVERLNKRTGFKWGDTAVTDDALEAKTKKAIEGRYSIQR